MTRIERIIYYPLLVLTVIVWALALHVVMQAVI